MGQKPTERISEGVNRVREDSGSIRMMVLVLKVGGLKLLGGCTSTSGGV